MRDNFTCRYCGRCVFMNKIMLVTDHIIPKSQGGKDEIDNILTCCSDCNGGKMDVMLTQKQLEILRRYLNENAI